MIPAIILSFATHVLQVRLVGFDVQRPNTSVVTYFYYPTDDLGFPDPASQRLSHRSRPSRDEFQRTNRPEYPTVPRSRDSCGGFYYKYYI